MTLTQEHDLETRYNILSALFTAKIRGRGPLALIQIAPASKGVHYPNRIKKLLAKGFIERVPIVDHGITNGYIITPEGRDELIRLRELRDSLSTIPR